MQTRQTTRQTAWRPYPADIPQNNPAVGITCQVNTSGVLTYDIISPEGGEEEADRDLTYPATYQATHQEVTGLAKA